MLSVQSIADELTDVLKKAYLINVNALMVLTSQDMLSSGKYKFGDDTIRVYNFPFTHHFKPYNRYFNFYVNGLKRRFVERSFFTSLHYINRLLPI